MSYSGQSCRLKVSFSFIQRHGLAALDVNSKAAQQIRARWDRQYIRARPFLALLAEFQHERGAGTRIRISADHKQSGRCVLNRPTKSKPPTQLNAARLPGIN